MSSGTGKGTRTRSGCKTCRNRRKKCDEGRPICQVCSRLGIQCGGYELALVWGNGVASRGRLKGAIVPLPKTRVNEEPSKAIPLGRDRAPSKTSLDYSTPMITDDLNVEVVGSSPGSSSNTGSANYEDEFYSVGLLSDVEPLSPALIESLIRDFFISGHHTLYSSSKADSPVVKAILPLAENSPTVRSVCATYQALVLQISVTQFQSLYDTALRQFRSDLTDPALRNQDSTVASGILLCSLGISQSLPWTFHVKPLLEILTTRQDFSESPFHAHALDIMGWYDLPGFVLNRRCARLDIWRRFSSKHESDGEYIEPVSNLPRSLLGILSSLEDPDCEERLWMWQGMEGTTLEIVLWDAYRYAAMLKHRELQRDYRRNLQSERYPAQFADIHYFGVSDNI
ncbi:hypothetical protein BKA65DRAFT_544300 [Rhexocercosporidium sp. MPI-PUGE-AT-0058]|nr:hypothetical protein BKA65DRAFT_544300 [Rhexocercosporidium sp. MPI-PUGE-AT-0058]